MVAVRKMRRWEVLAEIVNERGWKAGAELGVFKGQTFLYLLKNCPGLTLVGVDTWVPDPEQDKRRKEGGRSYARFDLEEFFRTVSRSSAPYGARARLMRCTTLAAAQKIDDGSLDFVFIDADHTYEGVSADIDAWLPKIRNGGMLLGHDFNKRDFPGVVKAVKEKFGIPALYPDHVWGVVKGVEKDSPLISAHWRHLNRRLHEERSDYGSKVKPERIDAIREFAEVHGCTSILDYGCGKGALRDVMGEIVSNYDPCVPDFSSEPVSADLVVCTDVLEHVEPERLEAVLDHMRALSRKSAYIVIGIRPDRTKTMPDGSNPHLIVKPASWWKPRIAARWKIIAVQAQARWEVRFRCSV